MKNLWYLVVSAMLLAACGKDSDEGEVPLPSDVFLVSAHEFEVPEEGGTISVEVYSTASYTVVVPEEYAAWISEAAPSKGVGQIRCFAVSANDGDAARTGFVVFGSDARSDTVRISQGAPTEEQPEETEKPIVLLLNGYKFEVSDRGDDLFIETNSTFECPVTIPEEFSSWISEVPATKGGFTNVRHFTVAANDAYRAREGYIVFGDEATTTDTVYVSQPPLAGVIWGQDFSIKLSPYVTLEMVYVEGGTFMMGATEDDVDAYNWDKPAYQVTLSDYYISKYEMTQVIFEELSRTIEPGGVISVANGGIKCVSPEEACRIIDKLNELTGQKYTLPTEEQWEYAARGGKKSQGYKYSGSNDIDEVAWYNGNAIFDYGHKSWEVYAPGQKKPNELGIYDMSGNVAELCKNEFYFYPGYDTSNFPYGDGFTRVLRGGASSDDAAHCSVTSRQIIYPRYSGAIRLVLLP